MKNPKLIVKPFAKNGQKNVIPENYETSMESNQATWDQGFGQITMLPVAAGGLPPKGQDFNGIFNQISENIVYLSQGGRFKFSAEYAEAIGGYPKGAILQSDDEKKEYLSLIDNNKVDFNTATDISASWKLVNTDDLLAQIASKQPKGDYATKTELNSGLAGKQPTGDYATKTDVGLKLDKNAVVQNTGTSTENVMSQKSVTDELGKKFDNTGGRVDGTVSAKVIKVSEDDGEELFLYPAFGGSPAFMQYHKGGVWSGKFLIPNLAANKILAPLMPGDVYSNTDIDAKINAIFSVGQQWKDVKSERSFNSVYHNSTGRAIQLAVNVQCNNWAGQSTLHIGPSDGSISLSFRLLDWAVAATQVAPVFIVIPDKWGYRITNDVSGLVIQSWLEYR